MVNWIVEPNGAALETEGLTFVKGDYSLSPIAILTFGFIVGSQDIWTNCTTPESVTWDTCNCG